MNRTARIVVTLLVLTFAGPAHAAFTYQRLPDVPHADIVKDTFVMDLASICDGFARLCVAPKASPALGVPMICTPESITMAAMETSARTQLSAQGDAVLKADDTAYTYLAATVQGACIAIRSAAALTDDQLLELRRLRDNPFLRAVLEEMKTATSIAAAKTAVAPGKAQGPEPATALPGFDGLQGRLIQGLSDFLAKRAKQEALAFLTRELQKGLCEEGRRDFFPSTCAAIDTLDEDRTLDSIRASFKAAVELDLKRLPDYVLAYLVEADRTSHVVRNVAFGGRVAIAFAGALRDGREPIDWMRSVGAIAAQPCETNKKCDQAGSTLRLASALFYAASQAGPEWVKIFPKDGDDAKTTAVGAVALLLLTEQRWLATDASARPIPLKTVNEIIVHPVKIWLTLADLQKIWKEAIDQQKKATTEPEKVVILARAVEASFERLGVAWAYAGTITGDSSVDQAVGVARELVSTQFSLRQRDYAVAFSHFGRAVTAGLKDPALPRGWDKHLAFLGELADAKTAADVSATLDAYAAPLGSYSTKYKTTRIAVNGMVGAWIGAERVAARGVEGTSGSAAVTAPVGIHITSPLGKTGADNLFHIGLLLSVIDVGAVTSVRFNDSLDGNLDGATNTDNKAKAEAAPKVGLAQVVAPGAAVTLGLFGSPFVLGAGISVSPELRRVSQTGASFDASVLRFGATLGVDIPIIFLL